MKISVHITLYLGNNQSKKLKDFKIVCNSFKSLSKSTMIFVHTNKKIKSNDKKIRFIYHDLTNEDPYKLTWKCRPLMFEQRDKFDDFIYSEDDTIFTKKNFLYWIKFKKLCKKKGLNLGFISTEKSNKDGKLWTTYQIYQLTNYLLIGKTKFPVLGNPYYAMWIYDKKEFKKFVKSKFWNLNNWRGLNSFTKLHTREKSAVGWHGLNMNRSFATVVPSIGKKIHPNSLIKHQSNKYVSESGKIHVSVNNLLSSNLKLFKPIKYSKIEILFNEIKFFIYWSLRFNFKNIKKIFL